MALGCASSQSRWGQPQSLFLVQFFSSGETLQVGINGSVSEPTGAHTKPFNEKSTTKTAINKLVFRRPSARLRSISRFSEIFEKLFRQFRWHMNALIVRWVRDGEK